MIQQQQYAVVRLLHESAPSWPFFVEEYLTHCHAVKEKSTVSGMDSPTVNSFSPYACDRKISEISRSDAEKWFVEIKGRMELSSVRTRVLAMRTAFQFAIEQGYLTVNPFSHLPLPPADFAGRPLSDAEIKALFAVLPPKYRRVCEFSLYTGLRVGEIERLEWSWISGNELRIPPKSSKNKRSRTLLIHPSAMGVIGEPGYGLVFGLNRQQIHRALRIANAKSGIGRVKFHDMRHTFASRYWHQTKDIFGLLNDGGWANANSAKPYQQGTAATRRQILGLSYGY